MSKKHNAIKKAYILDGEDIVGSITPVGFYNEYTLNNKKLNNKLVCSSCYDLGTKDVELYVQFVKSADKIRFNRKSKDIVHHKNCDIHIVKEVKIKKDKSVKIKDKCIKNKDTVVGNIDFSAFIQEDEFKVNTINSRIRHNMNILKHTCVYSNKGKTNVEDYVDLLSIVELNKLFKKEPRETRQSLLDDIKKLRGDKLVSLYGKIERIDNKECYESKMYLKMDCGTDAKVVTIRYTGVDKYTKDKLALALINKMCDYNLHIAILTNLENLVVINGGANVNVDIRSLRHCDTVMINEVLIGGITTDTEFDEAYKKKVFKSFIDKGKLGLK